MASLTDAGEKLLLDFLLTNAAVTRPTAWFGALFTTASSDSAPGTEVVGNGYARKALTFPASASGPGNTANSVAAQFIAAGGDWGTVTHFGVFTALTGGTMLLQGPLPVAKTMGDGDKLDFPVGNVSVTLG